MMCFYNDYDWFAEVNETTEGPATAATKCDECGAKIAVGEWRKHVHQQEHECCQICEDDCSGDFIAPEDRSELGTDGKPIGEHVCQYGETCEYDRCEACDKMIRAVIAREKREGCPANAQQPNLFTLWEELYEHGDRREYATEAVAMFPELASNQNIAYLLEREDD